MLIFNDLLNLFQGTGMPFARDGNGILGGELTAEYSGAESLDTKKHG